MDELDPVARIVWKLARNHTWGQPMPEQAVIDIAAKDEDRDEMRAHLNERWTCRSSAPGHTVCISRTGKGHTLMLQTGF